jgi:arsenite methyltransferase
MNRGNRAMNLRAIELLEAGPASRIADIGFGGGRAVDVLLGKVAHVTAIDPAADMVAALRDRHADAIAAGRLDVHEGGVEALPLPGESVDAALTVNTVYFWPELAGPLREVHRALAPGGTLVIAIRDGAVMENVDLDVFTIRPPAEISRAAEDAGFESWVESPPDQQVHFIVARKPGDGADPELFEG